jgi:hypothetical protein
MPNDVSAAFVRDQMSTRDAINRLIEQCQQDDEDKARYGEFIFTESADLPSEIIGSGVRGYGVYVIYGVSDDANNEELLYIGKSGTINQNGRTGKQGLCGRLQNKQTKKMSKVEFYRKTLTGELLGRQYRELRFWWAETYRNGKGVPPFLAEAQLLSAYLEEHGHLPPLNKAA